ncbi:MAG: DUF58 domain-containing protein [Candidatus Brocadiaceae bacterium]|nr:DUF58 domain-containing protein [Candidatus Brocadiaceae bacterium]
MSRYSRYFDPATLGSLSGLKVRARHIVEGYLTGLHRSPLHGRSVEFAEHRPYTPGHELRHVDWRLWARTDRFYVKLYEEETNVRAHFLVDASASMGYASGDCTKYACGAVLASSLACLLLMQQDAVGLALFDTEMRAQMPPSANPAALSVFCRLLEETAPGRPTQLADVAHAAADRLARRGLVVLVSDLLAPLPDVVSALRRLRYDGHSVVVVHVVDPAERDFPFDGPVRFEDMEGSGGIPAEARQVRAAYLDSFRRFRQSVEARCLQEGVDYVPADSDQPPAAVLGRLLTSRPGGY